MCTKGASNVLGHTDGHRVPGMTQVKLRYAPLSGCEELHSEASPQLGWRWCLLAPGGELPP